MKVIREGKPIQIECRNCGSLLEYEPQDKHEKMTHMNEYKCYITCPICNREIEV